MEEQKIKTINLICLGNEREEFNNTPHNVGFFFADKLKKDKENNLTTYIITNEDEAIVTEVSEFTQDNTLYRIIKPLSKNPFDINPEAFQNLKLKNNLDYYGYDEKSDSFQYGDYNSSGLSIKNLQLKGTILNSDINIIISDNNNKNFMKKEDFKFTAEDLHYNLNTENNGIKSIRLLNPELKFSRLDINTSDYQKGQNINNDKIDIEKYSTIFDNINNTLFSLERNQNKKKITKKEALSSINNLLNDKLKIENLDFFIKAIKSTGSCDNEFKKDFRKRLTVVVKKADKISLNQYNKISFLLDEYIDLLYSKEELLDNKFLKKEELFIQLKEKEINFANAIKSQMPSKALPHQIIKKYNKKTQSYNILSCNIEQEYSHFYNYLSSMGINYSSLIDFNFNPFDKKNYKNENSLRSLLDNIEKAVKKSTGVYLTPNSFNIRDEFKFDNEINKIDLKEFPDMQKTFVEMAMVNFAIIHQKPILGICGGMQCLSTLVGCNVEKLEQPQVYKGREDDFIKIDKRGKTLYHTWSAHTQGLIAKENKEKLDKTNLKIGFKKNGIIKSIYFDELKPKTIATQHHPEADPHNSINSKILKTFIGTNKYPSFYIQDDKMQQTIKDNFKEILNKINKGMKSQKSLISINF